MFPDIWIITQQIDHGWYDWISKLQKTASTTVLRNSRPDLTLMPWKRFSEDFPYLYCEQARAFGIKMTSFGSSWHQNISAKERNLERPERATRLWDPGSTIAKSIKKQDHDHYEKWIVTPGHEAYRIWMAKNVMIEWADESMSMPRISQLQDPHLQSVSSFQQYPVIQYPILSHNSLEVNGLLLGWQFHCLENAVHQNWVLVHSGVSLHVVKQVTTVISTSGSQCGVWGTPKDP